MDEVHYLADRFRGAVWEEVIIGLAESIQVVALSATVSNAEEFGEWLSEVRGEMAVVVSERRPVPLFQHVLVGNAALRPVRRRGADRPGAAGRADARSTPPWSGSPGRSPATSATTPAGRAAAAARASGPSATAAARTGARAHRSRHRAARRPAGRARCTGRAGRTWSSCSTPRRCCRRSCSSSPGSAATPRCGQLLGSGLRLTSPAEQRRDRPRSLDRHVAGLSGADLRALDYDRFAEALLRGIAAHHAGMLPAFKECVEEAFVRGLIKVVFATETLALGINMPARSRGAGEAGQVQRRDPRRHHAGGVHPADRSGRSARHRRRGSRRGALAAGAGPAGGRRSGLAADLSAAVARSRRPTTWRSTWSAASAGIGPGRCWSSRSPSSSPTARWSGVARIAGPQHRGDRRLLGRGGLRPRRLRGVRPAAGRDRRRGGARRPGNASADRRAESLQTLLDPEAG